jgi:hypothetical protein
MSLTKGRSQITASDGNAVAEQYRERISNKTTTTSTEFMRASRMPE